MHHNIILYCTIVHIYNAINAYLLLLQPLVAGSAVSMSASVLSFSTLALLAVLVTIAAWM